jgi:hypothetical protein
MNNLEKFYKEIINILNLKEPKGKFDKKIGKLNLNILEEELSDNQMAGTYRLYMPFDKEVRAKNIAIMREFLEPIPEEELKLKDPGPKIWTKVFMLIDEMKLI